MTDADRDKMLREMAANRGCKLVKSRRRTPGVGDYGRYGLKDATSDREVFGFGSGGLTATPEEIEAFLRKGAVADWKSSLASSASAANDEGTPVPRRRSRKQKPEPKIPARKPTLRVVEGGEAPPPLAPSPRPILKIREARPADAEGLAALIEGGDASGLAARLSRLRRAGEPPLVADEGGELVGALAFHALPLLQEEAPLGRIAFLFVAVSHRRRGIARALVEEAEARLVERGCARIEAMAEIELGAGADFFRRLGWERAAYRYARNLG